MQLGTFRFAGKVAAASAVIFSALLVTHASAQQTKSKLYDVIDRGKVVIGTGSTNVPWHFIGDDNKLAGFDIDIGKIIAKALFDDPNKVEFVKESPDARIPNLLTGKVDVVCQFMTINTARAQKVEFTIPYYREGVALLMSKSGRYKDRAALDKAIADGDEVHVAVLQNADAEATVHDVIKGVKVDQYEDQGLVFEAVDTGRAAGGVVDLSNVMWLVKQHPDRYMLGGKGTIAQSYGCAVKPGDQIWLNFLDTALREAMNGRDFDEYADAFDKWFGVRPPAPQTGFPTEMR